MYKVTIEKIETKTVIGREYEKIADSGNPHDKGAIYGYVSKEVAQTSKINIFEQTVEELDMTKVIKAVNNLQ